MHHRTAPRRVARQHRRSALPVLAALLLQGCAGRTVPATPSPGPSAPRTLVPAAMTFTPGQGAPFTLVASSAIHVPADSASRGVGAWLATLLRPATGYAIPLATSGPPAPGDILLELDSTRSMPGDEGYELDADAAMVRARARTAAGLFHAAQSIRQLLPPRIESDMRIGATPWTVSPVHIVDAPRFAWRGAMLDVSRHFFTVTEVEQFIDLLAMYKMNVLHLHLSDDQGWRIEIRSRPLLTEVGGASQVGGRPGGFYTQRDFADIVRYASDRFVTIVPEIDMPGHTNAALSAYPALSCSTRPAARYTGTEVGWSTFCVDSEATYALVDDVVRELAEMSPGPYIHLGGDEVHALTPAQYARFVERVQEIAARHGKRMIGWEEITQARLAPGTVAQQWRSDSVIKALAYGDKVILSPGSRAYLDMKYAPETELGLHWAGYVTLRRAYDWDPALLIPKLGEPDILGIEAPIWTETLRNIAAVQRLAVPRLPALAEVAWTPQAARAWPDFQARLAGQATRWELLGINWFPSPEVPW